MDSQNEKEIGKIASNKKDFDSFVYTSLEEAIIELEKRQRDEKLKTEVEKSLPAGIPEVFGKGGKAAIFRHLITPNYEIRRFLSIVDAAGELTPVLCEYTKDKFTANNELKHSLGRLTFHIGKGRKGGDKTVSLNIIDFNTYNGKKISEVKTLWGQRLKDFHRELFHKTYSEKEHHFFDASEWFAESGLTAKNYYESLLRIFVCHAILFENFLTDEKELSFTKETFLPAFIKVMKETGKKPLIVALEPTDIEGDSFWLRHPHEAKGFVDGKMS